jgi:hypothetical protein
MTAVVTTAATVPWLAWVAAARLTDKTLELAGPSPS